MEWVATDQPPRDRLLTRFRPHPVIETIARIRGPQHIETASWRAPGYSVRLRSSTPGVHHHETSRQVYDLVADSRNYAHTSHT